MLPESRQRLRFHRRPFPDDWCQWSGQFNTICRCFNDRDTPCGCDGNLTVGVSFKGLVCHSSSSRKSEISGLASKNAYKIYVFEPATVLTQADFSVLRNRNTVSPPDPPAHGGYLAGVAILMAWLGLDGFELRLCRDGRLWPTVRHHALLFTATVAACMLNPCGYELHTWMLSSLGRPRPEISGWAPLPLFSVDGLLFWCFALGTFLCLKKSVEPRRWPGLIVMSLLSWQAVKHQGHLPFAAMMGSFVLVPHIESVVRQLFGWLEDRAAEQHPSPDGQRSMGSIAVALMLFVVLSCAQFPRQATLNVNRDYHAVSAMPFMADNRLEGNVLVTFNGAQYALAVFADSSPESRIAFDGWFRTCYPQPIIDMYFDFILGDLPQHVRYREASSGPFDAKKALEYKNPDLVLIECERKNSVRTMEACSAEWCLLYQDSLAQLWGRRSTYDDQQSERFLPEHRRHRSNDLQQGRVAWPAFPKTGRPARRIELTLGNSGAAVR